MAAWPTERDRFKAASLFHPVSDISDGLRELLHEVTMIHRLIDYLHGDRPAALM